MRLVVLRSRLGRRALAAALTAIASFVGPFRSAAARPMHISCAESAVSAEVADYADVFVSNYYVDHDEPATLFYSNQPRPDGHKLRRDPVPRSIRCTAPRRSRRV